MIDMMKTMLMLVQADGYDVGNKALEVWNADGIAASPGWVQIWILVMLASFVLGLAFVRWHGPARLVVGGIIISLLTTRVVVPALGLIKLSGLVALVHVLFWTPALIALVRERAILTARTPYSIWAAWMVCVIVFSFIFDIRDAAIYVAHAIDIGRLP